MHGGSGDWFLDERFWEESYSFMFPEESFRKAEEQVERIIELSGQSEGALLDLCCGPGRHSIPLARRGFAVTAVDASSVLLERARSYADEAGVAIEWERRDMREFIRPDTFDLAINMFTSFGFFDDPADNLAVLENIRRSLKPGAALVMDMGGKEVIARKFEPTGASELPDGRLMIQRRDVIDDWGRFENEWLFIDGANVRTFRLRLWVYSGRELRQLLEQAGFVDITLFGKLDGTPYGLEASRLIAVARRPD